MKLGQIIFAIIGAGIAIVSGQPTTDAPVAGNGKAFNELKPKNKKAKGKHFFETEDAKKGKKPAKKSFFESEGNDNKKARRGKKGKKGF